MSGWLMREAMRYEQMVCSGIAVGLTEQQARATLREYAAKVAHRVRPSDDFEMREALRSALNPAGLIPPVPAHTVEETP